MTCGLIISATAPGAVSTERCTGRHGPDEVRKRVAEQLRDGADFNQGDDHRGPLE